MAHKAIDWAARKSGGVKETPGKPGAADWQKIRDFGAVRSPRTLGWNRYATHTVTKQRPSSLNDSKGKPLMVTYRSVDVTMVGGQELSPRDDSYDDFSHLLLTAEESRLMLQKQHEARRAAQKAARKDKKRARRQEKAEARKREARLEKIRAEIQAGIKTA